MPLFVLTKNQSIINDFYFIPLLFFKVKTASNFSNTQIEGYLKKVEKPVLEYLLANEDFKPLLYNVILVPLKQEILQVVLHRVVPKINPWLKTKGVMLGIQFQPALSFSTQIEKRLLTVLKKTLNILQKKNGITGQVL